MTKKNLVSPMNGIMGELKPQESTIPDYQIIEPVAEAESSEVIQEMKENLETKWYRNVCRQKKGTNTSKKEETRAIFIVDPELIRKLKYISLVESSLLKDTISEALTDYLYE